MAGLAETIRRRVESRLLSDPRLPETIVALAQRRIKNKGDSTHRYPELWATQRGIGYRDGGDPLQDLGFLMGGLSCEARVVLGGGVRFVLMDGVGYGVYHQHGFSTDGPNFIPLTLRARRGHTKGRNPKDEGFVPGVDYIMAWQGVTVPQRMIWNTPPEDVEDFAEVVRDVLAGR